MPEKYIESLGAQSIDQGHMSDAELLVGDATVSIETRAELSAEENMAMFAARDRAKFLRLAEMLPDRYFDMLVSYFLIGKTQKQVGDVTGDAQAHVAFRLTLASQALAGLLRFDGIPSACVVVPILQRIGAQTIPLPRQLSTPTGTPRLVPAGDLIATYLSTRSYTAAAARHGVRRQDTRRAIREIARRLERTANLDCKCLGAILLAFAAYSSASIAGDTKREERHLCQVFRVDPDALGQFEVRAGRDFPFFAPRADHAEVRRGKEN